MKKIMLLFACLSLLFVTGCKDKETDAPESLDGTTWVSEVEIVPGNPTKLTLTFAKSTFEMVFSNEGAPDKISGKYTYIDRIVTLSLPTESDNMVGTVEGDHITFDDDGDIIVFTRK